MPDPEYDLGMFRRTVKFCHQGKTDEYMFKKELKSSEDMLVKRTLKAKI